MPTSAAAPYYICRKNTMDGTMDAQQYEAQIKKLCNTVRAQARQRASFPKGKKEPSHTYKKGIYAGKTERKLKSGIKTRLHRSYGDIDNVAFVIPVHGIFRTYGVGKGQERGKSVPEGRVRRTPSDWITGPIDANFGALADLTTEYYGDNALLKISGVKSEKI